MGMLLNGGLSTGYVSGALAGCGLACAVAIPQHSVVVLNWFYGIEQQMGTTFSVLCGDWQTTAIANGLTLATLMYFAGGAPHWTISNGNANWYTTALNNMSAWIYSSAAGTGTTDLVDYYSSSSPQSWANYGSANAQTVPNFSYQGVTDVNAGMSFFAVTAQYYYDVLTQGLGLSKYGETDGGNPGYLAQNLNLNGVFIDNLDPWAQGTGNGTKGTWNGVGTTPVSGSTSVSNQLMNGSADLISAFRSTWSGVKIMANSNVAQALLNQISSLTASYQGAQDYQFNEAVIGSPGCPEENFNSPVGAWMTSGMIPAEAACPSTGYVVYHQVGRLGGVPFSNSLPATTSAQADWVAADWQACRAGFAAAMMRDKSIYMLNCGVQQYKAPGLLDEQVQGGNYSWLTNGSQRYDSAQRGPATQVTLTASSGSPGGIWVRRLPNGWILWNPPGNGAVTLTGGIPTTLNRIAHRTDGPSGAGYGDATVNTGNPLTLPFTMQDGDGLFLIGTG